MSKQFQIDLQCVLGSYNKDCVILKQNTMKVKGRLENNQI